MVSTASVTNPSSRGPRCPERFLNPLKREAIEPYNYITSRFIFKLSNCGAARSPIASLVSVRTSEGANDTPLDKNGNLRSSVRALRSDWRRLW